MRGWTLLLIGCGGPNGGGGDDTDGPVPTDPSVEVDADGDGFTVDEGDCDDSVAIINPAAADVVGDGFDQNCDGADGIDADGDGVANVVSGGTDCDDDNPAVSAPADVDLDGQTGCDGDCDDADPGRFTTNPEVCNGVDDDCAGAADVDAAGTDVCAREEQIYGTSGKLDLLIVVDDSCSMGPEQVDLAGAAGPILDPLLVADVHVGVVTTDLDSPTRSGRLRAVGGRVGRDGLRGHLRLRHRARPRGRGRGARGPRTWLQRGLRAARGRARGRRGLRRARSHPRG